MNASICLDLDPPALRPKLESADIAARLAALSRIDTADGHVEEMRFIEAGGRRYFAVRYLPAAEAEARATGVVQCHAFGFEQTWFRHLETIFARRLARLGYPVLYVQGQGYGDSEGDFGDVRISTHVRDVRLALEQAPGLLGRSRFTLQGTRLGALAAAVAASGHGEVDALVLWHPVADPEAHVAHLLLESEGSDGSPSDPSPEGSRLPPLLRERLERQGTIDAFGFPIVRELYEEAARFDLRTTIESSPPRTLLCRVGTGDPGMALLGEVLREKGSAVTEVQIPAQPNVAFTPVMASKISPEPLLSIFRRVVESSVLWLESSSR